VNQNIIFFRYRATFNLTKIPRIPTLYVPSASTFVGIYVNGVYITTLNPLGTEINSASDDPHYRFKIDPKLLHLGENILAFRVEVWGHGSFMFFRGSLSKVHNAILMSY
jgi:hypothetical protein